MLNDPPPRIVLPPLLYPVMKQVYIRLLTSSFSNIADRILLQPVGHTSMRAIMEHPQPPALTFIVRESIHNSFTSNTRSVHAATALDRHGNTGTAHQQRHDGEQHGSRGTGQRQLSDILHIQHGSGGIRSGVIVRLDLMKGIRYESDETFTCDLHIESDPEVLGVAGRSLSLHNRVGSCRKTRDLHQTIIPSNELLGIILIGNKRPRTALSLLKELALRILDNELGAG